MLSSIHPLGERGRHNRWAITVGSFAFVATATGAALGAALGLIGEFALGAAPDDVLLLGTGAVALVAGVLDLFRVQPPGPKRQVNETWVGHYRGWVYAGAFGFELGAGVITYIVTWGVFATFAAELFSASWPAGMLIGGVFGFGRSIALLAAGWIDRPSRLTVFHQKLADLGAGVRRSAAATTAGAGALGTLVGLM